MAQHDGRLVDGIALNDRPSGDAAVTWEHILGLAYLSAQVALADVKALLAEYDRTDALLPILDPKRYREVARNIPQHRAIAAAFLAFREAVERAGNPPRRGIEADDGC